MRRYAYLVAVVALVGCARSANVAQEQDALMAKDREWSSVAKDVDKFVSYFATDATIHAPGMPSVSGADAIRKTYGEMTSAPGFALSFAPTRAVVAASGDIGYTAGTYEMSMAGGTEKGKYVTTWKKENRCRVARADAAGRFEVGRSAAEPASGIEDCRRLR